MNFGLSNIRNPLCIVLITLIIVKELYHSVHCPLLLVCGKGTKKTGNLQKEMKEIVLHKLSMKTRGLVNVRVVFLLFGNHYLQYEMHPHAFIGFVAVYGKMVCEL